MSNHYVLRLKLMQCYVNYISVTRGKNDGSQIVIFFFFHSSPISSVFISWLPGTKKASCYKESFLLLFIYSFIHLYQYRLIVFF